MDNSLAQCSGTARMTFLCYSFGKCGFGKCGFGKCGWQVRLVTANDR
jgi:hypothetical protein